MDVDKVADYCSYLSSEALELRYVVRTGDHASIGKWLQEIKESVELIEKEINE